MTIVETATPSVRQTRAPALAAKPLLEVRGLQMYFPISEGVVMRRQIGEVKAVDGVDLTIGRGETLGLAGQIIYDGVDIARLSRRDLLTLRRRIQVIFQDPYSSLNPRMKIGSIIGEP